MHTLNILSLNVNGLNSAVKRTRVSEYLHRKSISCALIQETLLKQSDMACFQNKYYKLAAFSCALKLKGCLSLLTGSKNLKGWLTGYFLGLIVFMGCSLTCVHASFFKKRIIFHIIYLYSTPLCPFLDKRLDLFPVFMKPLPRWSQIG